MAKPDVSVVIPLYNKARYVLRAIESVTKQTIGADEIIVVDDGSTDNGADVVQNIPDARIRLIRQENQGPGAARNRGLRSASSNYISFLDADDEWLPEFLGTAFDVLTANCDCQLFVGGHFKTRNQLPFSTATRFSFWGVHKGACEMSPESISAYMVNVFIDFFHSGGIVAEKSVVEKFGGYYERGCLFGEDTYLWLQVALNCKAYLWPEPLMWYHTENSSLNTKDGACRLSPVLSDPEPIRRNCPPGLKDYLEDVLGGYAVTAAERRWRANQKEAAKQLLRSFPRSEQILQFFPESEAVLRLFFT